MVVMMYGMAVRTNSMVALYVLRTREVRVRGTVRLREWWCDCVVWACRMSFPSLDRVCVCWPINNKAPLFVYLVESHKYNQFHCDTEWGWGQGRNEINHEKLLDAACNIQFDAKIPAALIPEPVACCLRLQKNGHDILLILFPPPRSYEYLLP